MVEWLNGFISNKEGKTPLISSWFRSHVASISATTVDFVVTIFLTEIVALWYVISNTIGATAGGLVSFIMCRRWVFNQRSASWQNQALRYVIAVLLSIGLNTFGVWFLTEHFGFQYIMAKVITAVFIGISVNFFMFRYFVFK